MKGTGNIHNKAVVCRLIDIPALDLQKSFLRGQTPFMIIRLSDTSPPEDLSPPVIQNPGRSFLQRVGNHLPAAEVCRQLAGTIYKF
jgi:hypothetical protein